MLIYTHLFNTLIEPKPYNVFKYLPGKLLNMCKQKTKIRRNFKSFIISKFNKSKQNRNYPNLRGDPLAATLT